MARREARQVSKSAISNEVVNKLLFQRSRQKKGRDIMNKTKFIEYLKNGGKIQMIEFEGGKPSEKLGVVREAEKVQTNGVRFVGGSWIYFSDIDAKTIEEKDGIVNLGWCKYKLVK